jgi:Flp pilus assembly protein TadG
VNCGSRLLNNFVRDEGGAAAVEMALIGTLLAGVLLNAVEVARYASMSAQVTAASQAGAHALIINCEAGETPIATNCPNGATAATAAIRGTSLGAAVSRHGTIGEGWYCVTADSTLQQVAPADERPDDCLAVGEPSLDPGFYARVQAAYDYDPLFPGLAITEAFAPTIVRTAWMRLR